MRVRKRVLALTALAGAFAVTGALAIGLGGHVQAQTGSPTPAVNAGGPNSVPTARFFGSVTGGASGATIVANVGGVACGSSTVSGGQYALDIQAISGCTASGATVTFTIGGVAATPTGTLPAIQGSAVQLNLTVAPPTPSPTAPPPPPPPPPPPTRAPTAAPTVAPTVRPTAPPTPAPTAVVPAQPPRTGLGGGVSQQKPSGPAVVTAQKPAAAAPAAAPAAQRAAPALPNTGTGGMAQSQTGEAMAMLLIGSLVLVIGAAGTAYAYRRS